MSSKLATVVNAAGQLVERAAGQLDGLTGAAAGRRAKHLRSVLGNLSAKNASSKRQPFTSVASVRRAAPDDFLESVFVFLGTGRVSDGRCVGEVTVAAVAAAPSPSIECIELYERAGSFFLPEWTMNFAVLRGLEKAVGR